MELTHMLESMVDTEHMDTHTVMDTMERDLLMLSQRLRLTKLSSTPPAILSTQ